MTDLYEIIGKLLAAFVVGLLFYFRPKVTEWLEATTDKDHYDQLMRLIAAFAQAAEQLYHDQDPTGEIRQRFVQEQLRALGMEITEAVINMIEGAVWEINTENKKALVQTKGLEAMAHELEAVANALGEAAVQEALARLQKGGSNGNG